MQCNRFWIVTHLIGLVVSLATAAAYAGTGIGSSELYINEIFLDPGGAGDDTTDEYIELRGTPSMALDSHYLIFVENEDTSDHLGGAGEIDNIFDLSGVSLGSNGFLTLRQKYSPYTVAVGTTDLVNDGPDISFGPLTVKPGYGSGENSTIGASDVPTGAAGFPEGKTENGGFTAMLIHNVSGVAPMLGADLDDGNDGLLDIATGREGWEIIDSIGIHGEAAEAEFGSLYGQINFGADGVAEPRIPEGAQYVVTGWEIEYVGRWGNSTGHRPEDWHASNLTDDSGSGSGGVPDWRQSFTGAHPLDDQPDNSIDTTPPPAQDAAELESTQGVPYGTKLTTTLGAPNFMLGDYNKDGYVNVADYTVWRDSLDLHLVEGAITEDMHAAADHNNDFKIDVADYAVFVDAFTAATQGPAAVLNTQSTVPEPAAYILMVLGTLGLLARRPSE